MIVGMPRPFRTHCSCFNFKEKSSLGRNLHAIIHRFNLRFNLAQPCTPNSFTKAKSHLTLTLAGAAPTRLCVVPSLAEGTGQNQAIFLKKKKKNTNTNTTANPKETRSFFLLDFFVFILTFKVKGCFVVRVFVFVFV